MSEPPQLSLTNKPTNPMSGKQNDNKRRNALGGLVKRLPDLVLKGVALLIRVSTPAQLKNLGSIEWQREQVEFLHAHELVIDDLKVYEGSESASGQKFRPQFERLLRDIRAGTVGLVVVADVDRNARNESDSEELYSALADVGGIVVERGQFYDPRDASHRVMLRIRSAISQYDNDNRVFRFMTAKALLAKSLSLAIPLPTGLIWADPNSTEYTNALKAAKLQDEVNERVMEGNRTAVERGEITLRIMPYPDADVYKACSLALAWIIETRDLTEVLTRIASHPSWPRPGEFPVVRESTVRLSGEHPELPPVTWERVVARTDGREELGRARIANWMKRPALFGIYAHHIKSVADLLPKEDSARVWEPQAFVGFRDSSEYDVVRTIGKTKRRFDRRGKKSGPRSHAIPLLRCSHPISGTERCNRTLTVIHPSTGTGYDVYGHFYKTGVCQLRGHGFKVPMAADKVLIDTVTSLLSEKEIAHQLRQIDSGNGSAARAVARAAQKVAGLQDKLDFAEEQAFQAGQSKRTDRKAHWLARHEKILEDRQRAERELTRLKATSIESDRLSKEEHEAVLALAHDLPELIERAQAHDDLLAQLMGSIVACVYARRIGWATYQLEIELYSGERFHHVFWTRRTLASQPLVVWTRAQLGQWADPAQRTLVTAEEAAIEVAAKAAAELNNILGEKARPRWTADRVFSAVLSNSSEPTQLHGPQSLSSFCHDHAITKEAALKELLAGSLGNADLREGEFWMAPSDAQVHYVFPLVARRAVAESFKAPVDDVALVTELAKEFRRRPDTLWHLLEKKGAQLLNDASGRAYSTRSACKSLLDV